MSRAVVLTRHGKPVAALVSARDLALIEGSDEPRIRLADTGSRERAAGSAEVTTKRDPLRIAAEHTPPGPTAPPRGGTPAGPPKPTGGA